MFDERRKSKRFDILLNLKMRSTKDVSGTQWGITKNFSQGGLHFESQLFIIEPDEKLQFKIQHPKKNTFIPVRSDIAWKKDMTSTCLTGIKFIEIDAKAKKEILNHAYNWEKEMQDTGECSGLDKLKTKMKTVFDKFIPSKRISMKIWLYLLIAMILIFMVLVASSTSLNEYTQLSVKASTKEKLQFPSFRHESFRAIIMHDKNINTTKHEDKRTDRSISEYYHRIIFNTAKKYKIDHSLVYAMIKVESNWKIKAVSGKGATGLMQLMPSTAKEMAVKNLHNPEENIEGGIRYLRYLLDKFNGDVVLALAAYNAGPTKVRKYSGIPPIIETQTYVKRVLSIYNGEKPIYNVPPPQI
jgi:c-di-GMP-binding flagellar brake protein YcgR